MTDDDLIGLVQTYFAAVDAERMDGVLATLTPDCRFSVETHGVVLNGHEEIRSMFERLWNNHAVVRHDQFTFVPSTVTGRIAAQFQVTNTAADGSKSHKSNCNFFTVRHGRFSAVAVYMAGANTLDRAGATTPRIGEGKQQPPSSPMLDHAGSKTP